MKELKELGERVRKLKGENEARKESIRKLKGERKLLAERNLYLAEKLKEASVAYSSAGRRVLDLVETQVKPVKKKLEKFDSLYKKISDYEKSVSEGLEKIKGFEDVLNSLKTGLFGLEKGQAEFDSALKGLSQQTGRIGDSLLRLEGMKVDSKVFDKKVGELAKAVNGLRDGLNSSVGGIREGFQKSLDSLREDVDRLSERKEEKVGKDITEVEGELKGRIREMEKGFNIAVKELGEGFGRLGERLARMESVKAGGKEVGESIREMEKGMSLLRKEFNDSLLGIRKDVDKLSERKEEKLGKDITEVEEEFSGRVKEIEGSLNGVRVNFDTALNSLKGEMKRTEGVKKDEINRIVKEFFGIRVQIEERMKQLTEQFNQLDRFREEFRKGFENRLAGSELSVKKLGDTLSKIDNQLEVIGERGITNENDIRETGKESKESVRRLEGKIESLSRSLKSLKRESSKELDKLIEEAGS
jgi:DNA repair exonuclease SbcCD ATPase subunit